MSRPGSKIAQVSPAGLLLAGLASFFQGSEARAANLSARWVGQDGKDFVGAEPEPGPNGYQDVHVALLGWPSARLPAEVVLQGHGHGAWSTQVKNRSTIRMSKGQRPGVVDLYFEPYQRESGREFELKWKSAEGDSGSVYFKSGKADPNVRVAGLGIEARWADPARGGSPEQRDRTGPGVAVGPDGVEDAHLVVSKLDPKATVRSASITVGGLDRPTWRSGVNLEGARNAEFVRSAEDPTRGDLFFTPTADLSGKAVEVSVEYDGGRTDSAAAKAAKLEPRRPVPPPKLANLAESSGRGRWIAPGDPAAKGVARGEARVVVEGLPAGKAYAAAALSDGVVGTWLARRDESVKVDAGVEPMRMRVVSSGSGRLELAFVPVRDESGASMTLRLVDASGREEVVRFAGGPVDFSALSPPLPPGSAQARPGDDLQALANRNGTIQLAPGVYPMKRPLIFDRPVHVVGAAGATLQFSQAGDQKPWAAAIKVHDGGTTLEGFGVRFAGPVRWDREVAHGPAVIATTDNRDDRREAGPKHGVNLVNLDLEGPPASTDWEEAVNLVKVLSANSGRIEKNVLKGGTVVFGGGPWSIADNDYRGTVPHTYNNGVLAALYPHDLTIARNHARDVGPSGKTWRFLVLAQRGAFDKVVDNVVEGGIGPREDDPHPHNNAPEVILTEAYRLRYEGRPAAISPDGLSVAIHHPQGGPAGTGDSLAILDGPQAGQWRTIAQPLGPKAYLLDRPIDPGTSAVSIATGFVRETFERNIVDCRGSGIAAPLVLAGDLFGVRVAGNRFIGGGETVRLHASPTESPVHWGWSHAPFLGGVFEGNVIEDAAGAGSFGFGVEHGPAIKSNRGRVYMTLALRDNTIRWTDEGNKARAARSPSSPPPRLAIGYAPSLDPDEMVIDERGTKVEGASGDSVWVNAAKINGKVVRDAPLRPSP